MKKIFFNIIILSVFLFISSTSVLALINSENDIDYKILQLSKIADCNVYQFINKSELIGNRADKFENITKLYQNEILSILERLKNISQQIETYSNNDKMSEEEKENAKNSLYHDAETLLYEVDTRTLNYLFSLRNGMPSVSYQRYSKKFKDFYDNLNISR